MYVLKDFKILSNIVDPHQTAPKELSDIGQHCHSANNWHFFYLHN